MVCYPPFRESVGYSSLGRSEEVKRFELLLHFLQALAAEVAHLHHISLVALHQLRNGVDTRALEAIEGTHAQVQLLDGHLEHFFLLVVFS